MNALENYFALARAHPELFANPPEAEFIILLDEVEIREVEQQVTHLLKAKGLPTEWARVGIAYHDQYTMILRDAVCFREGQRGTCTRMIGHGTPGVIVLPVCQGQILLIRHFRHATRNWHLEIPRGFGAKEFSSEENVRMELAEEVGATVSRLVSLGQVYPDTGAFSEYNEIFYAEIVSYSEVENGTLVPTPISEFERMVRENEITDGFTITAYGLAKGRGLFSRE